MFLFEVILIAIVFGTELWNRKIISELTEAIRRLKSQNEIIEHEHDLMWSRIRTSGTIEQNLMRDLTETKNKISEFEEELKVLTEDFNRKQEVRKKRQEKAKKDFEENYRKECVSRSELSIIQDERSE